MNPFASAFAPQIPDDVLGSAIETTLADCGATRKVIAIDRRQSDYATSCALEEIDVQLDDGARLALIFKDVSPSAVSDRARRVKPPFLIDPRREIEVYRTILAPHRMGPRLYASELNTHTATFWLLTEKIRGREMYQIGELDSWMAAAQWLASMHRRFATADIAALGRAAHLCMYDRQFYTLWMERALRFVAGDSSVNAEQRADLEWLAQRYDRVVDRLLGLPVTIVHGEFCASNVLIAVDDRSVQVWPVDWEMTAIGPGFIDLASLTLGDWREADRCRVIAAYAAAMPDAASADVSEIIEVVDYCQIHLAVQWLGWFGRRRPPAEHARDWLAEAVARAKRVGL